MKKERLVYDVTYDTQYDSLYVSDRTTLYVSDRKHKEVMDNTIVSINRNLTYQEHFLKLAIVQSMSNI